MVIIKSYLVTITTNCRQTFPKYVKEMRVATNKKNLTEVASTPLYVRGFKWTKVDWEIDVYETHTKKKNNKKDLVNQYIRNTSNCTICWTHDPTDRGSDGNRLKGIWSISILR